MGALRHSIGIWSKVVDLRENVAQVLGGVRRPRVVSMQTLEGGVDIDDDIDTGSVENGHAGVVIGGGIDIVDANGVDTELLQNDGIAKTGIAVAQNIVARLVVKGSLTTGLVVNTDNLQTLLGNRVYEGNSADIGGLEGTGRACEESRSEGPGLVAQLAQLAQRCAGGTAEDD